MGGLFSIYISPFSSINEYFVIQSHHLTFYVACTQIYASITLDTLVQKYQTYKCVFHYWIIRVQNRIKYNAEGTELILIGIKLQRQKSSCWFPIDIFNQQFPPTEHITSLVLFSHQESSTQLNFGNTC